MTSRSLRIALVREIRYGHAILLFSCLLGFAICILVDYPGFMSNDSYDQLIEARNGIYSDTFPPFMSVLWRITDRLIPGAYGMLLLQTAVIWLGTFLIALYWFSDRRITLNSFSPLLIVFLPPVFGISGMIWKDLLMSGFLMVAIGVAGSLTPVSSRPRWGTYVKLAIVSGMLFLAMLVRYNSGFAAVPIMVLSIARTSRRLRLGRIIYPSIAGILGCVVLQVGATLVTESFSTYKTNPWGYIAIFDTAGIIYRIPDRQEQENYYAQLPSRVRGEGSLDRLLRMYSPRNMITLLPSVTSLLDFRAGLANAIVDWGGQPPAFGCAMDTDPAAPPNNKISTNCFEWTEEEKQSFLQVWKASVTHFPLAWLSHRISIFLRQIRLDSEPLRDAFFPEYGFRELVEAYDSPHAYLIANLNTFQNNLKRILAHPYTSVPIYRPWAYLLLSGLIIGACLFSATEKRVEIALIAASGIAHSGGVFLLACSAEYRYLQYMIYTSILGLFLLLMTYWDQLPNDRCSRELNPF
jgi:hypothetical protein